MTLEEFNNLKKGARFYRISTLMDTIIEYTVNKRKNNICYVNSFYGDYGDYGDYEFVFTYKNAIKYKYILYKDLIDHLSKIPKDNLVKILQNKSNDKIIKDIKIHFVEYLI